jgi:hypothetical protein
MTAGSLIPGLQFHTASSADVSQEVTRLSKELATLKEEIARLSKGSHVNISSQLRPIDTTRKENVPPDPPIGESLIDVASTGKSLPDEPHEGSRHGSSADEEDNLLKGAVKKENSVELM